MIKNGERLPEMSTMMEAKNKPKPFGHGLLILLVLIALLLAVLGNFSVWTFAGFLLAGLGFRFLPKADFNRFRK